MACVSLVFHCTEPEAMHIPRTDQRNLIKLLNSSVQLSSLTMDIIPGAYSQFCETYLKQIFLLSASILVEIKCRGLGRN